MSQDDTNRVKLARLADALIEDVMATPDADIIAEVDHASIDRARARVTTLMTTETTDLITQALEAADRLEQMQRISVPEVVSLIRRLAEALEKGNYHDHA